ncbi:hypothetical protein L486_02096 [Kwoniella mangroviensis CBS 10435]|uniref:FAD-binding PCMH-type domain-containing protein n=1 Tax=Kwoniella mangroviensis CBS 10435 TaxID=1331196 RepID=A0A1B9IV72_9TREE|nr:hypothetical protein L486_02096 [Kwoniella mangroviensis CBS 10435]
MLDNLTTYPALQGPHKGDLLLPSDDGYKQSVKRFAATAQKPAGLVAFVKDDGDIQAVLSFAKEENIEIAVECGGHSVSGASSTSGGIVIDHSRYLNEVTVDVEQKIAHVGGGATWRDVDLATSPHGMASVAGTVSHTGVGGLTLFDILFWAILGGGGNFGIVPSFSLRLHPQRSEVFTADLHFPGEKVVQFFEALGGWLKMQTEKDLLFIFFQDMGNGPVIMAHCFHNGPQEDGKKHYKAFYGLGPIVDTTEMIPYLSLNQAIDDDRPYGTGLYWHGTIFPSPITHPEAGHKLWESYHDVCVKEPEFSKSTFTILEFHHPSKLMERSNGEMAFNNRGEQINMLIGIGWDGILGNQPFEKAKKYAKGIANAASDKGENEDGYANWESNTPTGYNRSIRAFGDKYPRLQALKARYDPNNMFNKWHPIEPKAD